MYRKNNIIATALFELKDGISAPFHAPIVKIDKNISLIQKRIFNKTVTIPMYLHSFRFITPKKVSETQKFALKFPTADTITTVSDKLRYYRHKKGLYQIDIADYLGIERSTYSAYEEHVKDYYAPEIMNKIAKILDVNVYDLLDEYNKFMYDGQGQYIKQLRKRLRITQKELAIIMNVDLYKVKRWEQNKTRMFKYTYEKLISINSAEIQKIH